MPGNELEEVLLRFRKLPKPVRVVYARPRTFISIVLGITGYLLLPASLRPVTRMLIGWDVFATFYLALVCFMMWRSEHHGIRRNAVLQDDGRFLILLVTALGAFASIAAMLANAPSAVTSRIRKRPSSCSTALRFTLRCSLRHIMK